MKTVKTEPTGSTGPTGTRQRVLRTPGDLLSLRLTARMLTICLALLVAVLAIGTVAMTTGDYQLSVTEVLQTLVGNGPPGADFVVTTLRLPRLLTGLFVGAALAVSGAIMQSVSGNALGSPDIIGFTFGSSTGALIVIVVLNGSMFAVAGGALAGGIGTAIVLYLLAYKNGVHGLRLILVGIGVGAMLVSVNGYLLTRASLQEALAAQTWLVGTLNGRGWEHAEPVGIGIAVLLPIAFYYGRRLAMLELGDDKAKALGVPAERSRLVLIVVSVMLVSIATAAAGPITFLALAAPQLARRLTKAAGPALVASALMGAFLLVLSDFVVQRAFSPTQLPVGIATGAIGGLYLAWLLAHEWRRGRA
ncbi:FecCD family ABC transporter permease [Amycolatopsis nigrescens]|uniref:FecCD family ABC transporter permease n=1 Tax=Amycolatopsis nigrescens TaxID=381445 RepID=UPI001FE17BA8|nr:iron chelate uptake ABC transporter family permease subunit [Amycolatopsis nigrescens]